MLMQNLLPRLVFNAALFMALGFITIPTAVNAQRVAVYETTPDLRLALAPRPRLHFMSDSTGAKVDSAIIDVDDSKHYQTMEGFGAAMTDSSAWLLEEQLSPEQRAAAMHGLFDAKNGISISFVRVPLGASDLARNHYSYDDMPKGQRDPGLTHFSIDHDRVYILPVLHEAFQINPRISVMATPWSAPGWMKTKDSMNGGQLKEDAYSDFAQYLVRSVQAYQQAGIPVRYLSLQNEPLYETSDYPGTLMPAEQEKQLIARYVGPAFKQANLSTSILAYDHNWDHPEYPLAILGDSEAAQYVAGSAFHCYGGNVSAQGPVHERYPNKGLWMTECSGGTWQKGNLLAVTEKLVIESTRQWAKSVVLWGIALDEKNGPNTGGCATCRGLLTVNRGSDPHSFTYTQDYYGLGQASRFVKIGAVRIDSTDLGEKSIETSAFRNPDGEIVLLALNNAESIVTLTIHWNGKSVHTAIDPGSVATFLWK